MTTVVVSGNPRPGSRTLALALAVAARLPGPAEVIDVGALGAGLLVPDDPATAAAVDLLRKADTLVVATPTYKGSYTGILKVLFDRLPAGGLDGIVAVPVVVAAAASQAAAAADILRRLLAELGATVTSGLLATEADLADLPAVVERAGIHI